MSRSARVAVILVSWNRAADLRLALEAIFASKEPPEQVIVVDNASTDDSARVASSFPGVQLIQNEKNLGFAEPHEIALRHTDAQYLALINNDALVEPGWIGGMSAFLDAHPEAAAVGGKQYFWDEQNPPFDRQNRYYGYTVIDDLITRAIPDAPDDVREVATLSGSAVMIRSGAIDDVGAPFLDPVFFAYYEETDFFARAVRKGWKLFYTPEPVCWHRVRASTAHEPYRYLYLMLRNRVIWAYRNFDDASLARVLADRSGGIGDEARARRDAYAWVDEHRALLDEHRARFYRNPGFLADARSIQARASYYGYARPEVCALVPEHTRRVLDFGCAGGALGKTLKAERPGIEVRGVEPVPDVAARARSVLDDVHVGQAEDALPADWPRPDCVIFADVLEHLVDPWAAVRRARALLEPGGALVVSIPNVLHHSVVADLVRGRFDYRDAGVLDRTHLRFFTAATARELIEQAGFAIERIERVVDTQRFAGLARNTPVNGKRTLRSIIADVCTVQYLIVAR